VQVLKLEIEKKIIQVSGKLFYKHGYNNTSMRQIAKEVEISVSNLYKYFKNKASIFDVIIREYYENYKKGFEDFLAGKNSGEVEINRSDMLTQVLFETIKNEHVKFVLLMDRSRGTKYENFKEFVISALADHMRIHTETVEEYDNEFILRLFARNFFYSILEIAKNYKNSKWAYLSIKTLVNYHLKGMSSLR